MKILIVNSSDLNGGAARAAYRLHQSLLRKGIDSKMMVQNKVSDDFTVVGPSTKFDKLMGVLRPRLDALPFQFKAGKTATRFSTSWVKSKKLVKAINDYNPDIVHLHWVNAGMLRVEDIAEIKAPIVWSLHDMWPIQGGWHYEESNPTPAQEKLDKKILTRKIKTFRRISKMTIVGVSRWLAGCANNSQVFTDKRVVTIPNPINTSIYKACDKNYSRNLWGLPKDKTLILFGAMGATSDPRKGFKELTEALSKINRSDIEFVIFGSERPQEPPNFPYKTHYVGTLSDDISLVTLYSAVDVMLVPSLQEAFGQTASEAMSCSTPVVAFSHTGLLDIVDHKKNGYLASSLDTVDLAKGISWVIDNDNYEQLCFSARDKVLREFDSNVVAEKFIALYKEILIN